MTDKKSKLLQAIRTVRDTFYASVQLQLTDERLTYQQIADANCISLAPFNELQSGAEFRVR